MEIRPIDANALMERLTRKKADVANQRYTEGFNDALLKFRSMLHSEPTLDCATVRHYGATSFVTTEDIDKYNSRIVLDEGGKSRFCRIFYEDGETDTSKWISVKDDLPAHVCTPCLIYADGCTSVADWSHDKYGDDWWFYVDGEYDPEVTHWMPLPSTEGLNDDT